MFTFNLSVEELRALWETLSEKEKASCAKGNTDPGFKSLCQKIRQGPHYAVDIRGPLLERGS